MWWLPSVSSAMTGHSWRASAPKWMWAACGWSGTRPCAAMVTVILLPLTSTKAWPAALWSLTGGSDACVVAVPAEAGGARVKAATSPSAGAVMASAVVLLMTNLLGGVGRVVAVPEVFVPAPPSGCGRAACLECFWRVRSHGRDELVDAVVDGLERVL